MKTAESEAGSFTDSAGRTLRIDADGNIWLDPELVQERWKGEFPEGLGLGLESQTSLEEYFQFTRDAAFGRWRWPANDAFLVYPNRGPEGSVLVIDETTGDRSWVGRAETFGSSSDPLLQAARAYYASTADPSKPWRNAKPGEIWAVTIRGREIAGKVDGDMEIRDEDEGDWLHLASIEITAGRRLWPEPEPTDAEGANS